MMAGDHDNIMYIMSEAHRPRNLPVPYADRLNRWCLDLLHEDFVIFSVPGGKNLFNDYHTRGGAPAATRGGEGLLLAAGTRG